ncbi:xanthine dehydrogenase family protein subunit M [Blastococcus sp. LR1]|uniref:FAD binding domain-containing protein n=1 Tax=Blastococcus sp. LR1 TaxID=2877000 RepID=UPI001CCE26CE|nr:FAD binding domain-containing protein [Blastococcus sp. LR1]MCA0145354.1 FAD binding domain-containing protein [Blastococcus sp. LR1]
MDLGTVEEFAPAALGEWQPGDAWLAGGTWLFSEPQPQLRRLLDLQAFGWPPLTAGDDGLEIAATCTLTELARYAAPAEWPAAALFRRCCEALLGSFKVRSLATVGGNLCLALPAGPMTALAAALDGVCTLWAADGTQRSVRASEFVTGNGTNVLRPGELLRSVHLPASALRSEMAFRRTSLSPHGRSAALVIGRRDGAGAVLTVTAATVRPVQLRFDRLPDAEELAAALDAAALPWHDDVHGLPAWRAHMTGLLAEDVRAELAR